MNFTITRATAPTDAIRLIFSEIEAFFGVLYSPEQRHGLSLDAIFQPGIEFFTASNDGEVVGCAGIAFYPDFGEIKRMFVRQPWRGRGAAQALLAQLESTGRAAGLSRLRLETGIHQLAALKFYEREGFAPCAAFEPYTTKPPETLVTSLFYEKPIVLGGEDITVS